MLISRVTSKLHESPEFAQVSRDLALGSDATLAVAQSARPLLLASLWSENPRPCLYVVSGEEAADQAALAISAWLGLDVVSRFPERRDHPWSEKAADDAIVGARCRSLSRLATGEPCVVVASARSLMRCVPPAGSGFFASATFAVGDEVPFEDVAPLLVGLGYADEGEVVEPGRFHVHGDVVDVFPAQQTSPVRIEFFGDEVDRVRRMVAATGQTIGELDSVEISPCREIALTPDVIARAEKRLWASSQEDSRVAADLELIRAGSSEPSLDRYLPLLYGGSATPLAHLSKDALVVLAEPRSLFDDCQRYWEDLRKVAANKHEDTKGLFVEPRELDFGKQQRLSFATILLSGRSKTAELQVRQPSISGSAMRFLGRIRSLVRDDYAITFAVPDRAARASLELRFTDEGIPFQESLANAPENREPLPGLTPAGGGSQMGATGTKGRSPNVPPLATGLVTFVDAPVPQGTVVPTARYASLSVADLTTRGGSRASRRRVDITQVTFPFKPGDYVVHATHGIAFFRDIVRQEVSGSSCRSSRWTASRATWARTVALPGSPA